jgi:uncharacterized protein YijF (DUF1287 family)
MRLAAGQSGDAFAEYTTRSFLCALLALSCAAQSGDPRSVAKYDFRKRLADAAIERTQHTVRYDPAYVRIAYPGGDVPPNTGVCTDEVIRSYRAIGIDLQKEVHEDMVNNFSAYPRKWNWLLAKPDTLGGGVPHIGIVVDRKGPSGRFEIVHNIGQGPQIEDVLFDWRITGHYRYYGPNF